MTSQHCQSVVGSTQICCVILSSVRGPIHKKLKSICFLQEQKLEKANLPVKMRKTQNL